MVETDRQFPGSHPASLSKAVSSGFSESLWLKNNYVSKVEKPSRTDSLILTSGPHMPHCAVTCTYITYCTPNLM